METNPYDTLEILPLSAQTLNDWLDFFDNRAFSDNPWWGSCYCTHFHKSLAGQWKAPGMKNRDFAAQLIRQGLLKGYVAYAGQQIVGWCNANDKQALDLPENQSAEEQTKVMAVVCFVIEKAHRNKGIATRLLQRIMADARDRGYTYVEAYPSVKAKSESGNFKGPMSLYLKNGFREVQMGRKKIVRNILQ